jgi:hypothetical protein
MYFQLRDKDGGQNMIGVNRESFFLSFFLFVSQVRGARASSTLGTGRVLITRTLRVSTGSDDGICEWNPEFGMERVGWDCWLGRNQ